MTQIGPETAFELIRRLIAAADEREADAMVTVCPMCQLNLDAYQGEMNQFFGTNYHMPILFFTQLMGLAFGIEAEGTWLWPGTGQCPECAGGDRRRKHRPKRRPRRPGGRANPKGLPMPKPLSRDAQFEELTEGGMTR